MAKKLLSQLHSTGFFLILILFVGHSVMGQSIHLGNGGSMYLGNQLDFSSGQSPITLEAGAVFSLEAGNSWGSSTEYVDGEIEVIGTGTSLIPIGDGGVYAPVNAVHSTDITASYTNAQPLTGGLGAGVDAVADKEFWELEGTAVITLPWNENSGIEDLVNANGGVLNSVTIVGYQGGNWNLTGDPQSQTVTGDVNNGTVTSDTTDEVVLNDFDQFTFGIDHEAALSIDDLFLTTGISLLANPVLSGNSSIEFITSNDLIGLKVSVYDINGRMVRHYDDLDVYQGRGSIPKTNLRGLFFMKFEHEGKQGVKKIIIE